MIASRSQLRYRELPGRLSANPFEAADLEAFSVRIVRVRGEPRRIPHRHPHSQEVIYVARGRGHLWQDGAVRPFEEGDCALIPRGAKHATFPEPGSAMELVCFWPHPDLENNLEDIDDFVITIDDLRGMRSE